MFRKGRFEKEMEASASSYTDSLEEDVRLFKPVVQINMAHTIMLADRGIISKPDSSKILKSLLNLYNTDVAKLDMSPEFEDIHMVVEEFVIKEAGEVGGKMHTAKSRNDQVAGAIKIALRDEVLKVQENLIELVNSLLSQSEKNLNTLMPGYTHTQIAEPTTFAHYMAAHSAALLRDIKRLDDAYESLNSCPLGACAFAGTSLPIDRNQVANMLGFKRLDDNTIDSVSSRDFALQIMSALAISMVNMSRIAEEVLLWSSVEFNMIEVPDEFASTSSIMPQKKNSVVAEIARAKAGQIFGDLMGALSLMKALPLSYNLDLQELTPMLWNAIDQTRDAADVMSKMMAGVKPNKDVMKNRVKSGFSTATELADTLVMKLGLPFRDAHAIVGRLVLNASREGKTIDQLTVDDLKSASKDALEKKIEISESDFTAAIDPANAVAARGLPGGPAPKTVAAQIKILRDKTKQHTKILKVRDRTVHETEQKLLKRVRELSR